MIPSFRDPSSQLRISAWSWYGKLLRHLVEKHTKTEALERAFAEAAKVADDIFSEIHRDLQESSIQVAFPGTEVRLRFNAEQRTDLYKSTQIYVDDGFNSLLSDKGAGIQSATIIGLFSYFTRNVNVATSALLCVEEPELYLHPHARRVVSARLDEFVRSGSNQVVVTTHSTEFIAALNDLNVILVRKSGSETTAAGIDAKKIRKSLFDAHQAELYFADKVILCEGLDAPVLRAVANNLYPGLLDSQNVTVVGVGGKGRLAILAKAIVSLGLQCFILADFDFFVRDNKADGEKFGARKHLSVENLNSAFFTQDATFGAAGSKVISRITKLRTALKSSDEEAFYTAKRADAFNDERLSAILAELRSGGVGILGGEIEDTFVDRALLDDGKVTVDTIYRLHAKLADTEDIRKVIDVSEIEPFLDRVLGFR
ncbi:MAG TPA: AAA family ATPase [Thermoanaerobaculia bacterium]